MASSPRMPTSREACAEARITFVGPTPEQLKLFGDKARARAHAAKCKVPVLPGTEVTNLAGAVAFFKKQAKAGIALKAIAGGGGRGMRLIKAEGEITDAFARASAEAKSAFGNGDLYAERLVGRARHIEVQIVGDGKGGIVALGERECTLQRRSQKIVELAPSPNLKPALRKKIVEAAVTMAKAVKYRSLGTFEFLVDEADYFFIEANPRLQVEHTVTEEVWGVDLVKAQLLLAGGASLAKAGLEGAAPRGHAIQLRVNMETMTADGSAKPGGGTLTVFEPPSGPGVRVDTYGYAGYRTNPNFDSLLAKVIVHSPSADFADALSRAERALAAFRLEGAPSNIAFLRALLAHADFRADKVHTRFVDEHAKKLIDTAAKLQSGLYFQAAAAPATSGCTAGRRASRCGRSAGGAGVRQDDSPGDLRGRRRRAGRNRGGAGADAGHDRQPLGQGRRRRGRRPAAADHGRHEDAARDPQPGARLCAADRGRGRRDDLRRPCAAVRRGGRRRGEGRGGRGDDRPRPYPARPRRIFRAPRAHARRQAARRAGAPAQDQPADGAAESRRPGRSRQLRRMGRLRHRQPKDAADAGGPDREDPGRRAYNRHRPGQRLAVRPREEPRRGGALRLHRAGRHPGQDQPSQEGPPVRDRRGAAHPAGLLHRGRRRPAGRRRRAVGGRPQHHGLPHLRAAERRRRPWSASTRAAASPATPRCWAAATW